MSKDRAAPFSRKHRKYWIPVTGGMILIGVINVAIGFCTYEPPPSEPPEKIELDIPKPRIAPDAGVPDAAPAPVPESAPAPAIDAAND